MTNAEWDFTDTNDYCKRFVRRWGIWPGKDSYPIDSGKNTYESPEVPGKNLINFTWMCLPLGWQSGVTFNAGMLVSWDKNLQSIWIQPMPKNIFGFDVVSEDTVATANPIRLSLLAPDAQEWLKTHNKVIKVPEAKLKPYKRKDWGTDARSHLVDAVANFGHGPIDFLRFGMYEKDEQQEYSYWFSHSSWLVTPPITEEIIAELWVRIAHLRRGKSPHFHFLVSISSRLLAERVCH